MKRLLSVFATFGAAAAIFTACHSNNQVPPPAPAGESEGQGVPAWKLKLTSTCTSDTATDGCVGAYGFTVLADARYQVGPGPAGQIIAGTLDPQEFSGIHDAVVKLLPAPNGVAPAVLPDEACGTHAQAEAADTISLNRLGYDRTYVHAEGTNFCYRTATADDAEALHTLLRTLAKRYYPSPFPNPCTDAVGAAQDAYPALRQCGADADCAYIDTGFQPVGPDELQFVVTDNCSYLKPIIVANGASVTAHLTELTAARDHARDACADRFGRLGCQFQAGFQATIGAPVCIQGLCRESPALGARR